MSVQVCLGCVDEWPMEHNDTHSFLESSFGSTINATVMKELPIDDSVCLCRYGTHDRKLLCPRCKQIFGLHTRCYTGKQFLGSPKGSPKGQQSVYYWCTTINMNISDWKSRPFQCSQPKEFIVKEYFVEGKYETRFNISMESDRMKMKSFSRVHFKLRWDFK
jgi:hypothetical protein